MGISGLSSGSQVQVSLSLMVELVSDFALIQSILASDLSWPLQMKLELSRAQNPLRVA